jgi:hypothetical protein
MIERKAFWIAWALVIAMLAAAAWRVSLLPDWTHLPRYDSNGVAISPTSSAVLLTMPGGVLFIMARLAWRARTARAPVESLRPWKKWASIVLVPISVILTLMQAFTIARSLGLLSTMNIAQFTRGIFVVLGLVAMVINNALPKLPWLRSRVAFLNLDPDKGAKFLRLRAWLGFLIGLVVVLGGLFLPLNVMPPIVFSMVIASVIVSLAFRFSAKRGQPQ